ncbi:MAG: 3-methyl-2-oxobutanoate hydroxymethyltransferase [Bdellovibrio sp.]|nr:MAG: 3-methyl-2-oxobutanoate hydroxymethyltransferase [Bdellovibrio sp.]
MDIYQFRKKKEAKQKISMVTCYDYWSAKIINSSPIDAILVGDSVGMVMYGYENTLSTTSSMIAAHVEAVKRGAPDKFIVADWPFLAKFKNLKSFMEAGAHAVKVEGAGETTLDLIAQILDVGVPVMGHLGLTPQFIHQMGGYRVQGRSMESAQKLLEQAQLLEEKGCFALVLECVPSAVAQEVTQSLEIPVIGIGAGVDTDGQVLVLQDLLGFQKDFFPRFVRKYMDGAGLIEKALKDFHEDVKQRKFPSIEESYE